MKKIFILAVFLQILIFGIGGKTDGLFAEILVDRDLNYSLDVPEGFKLDSASADGKSIMFTHPNIHVVFVIKIYENKNSDSLETLKTAMGKLGAKAVYDDFDWFGNHTAISSFGMTLDNEYKGWSVCSPLEKPNSYIALLAYAPALEFEASQQFIMSILNSLSVSDLTSQNPGVFVTYAFPKEGRKNIALNIGGTKINTNVDKSDEEANQFVVDLEYSVLTLYAKHPLWKEAWQRYYRLIFRDSYGRLSDASSDIHNALYPKSRKSNPASPDTALLTVLLSWTQDFEYKRDTGKNATDFTPPISVISGVGNDCDARSMLLCCLMQHYGINSIILVSNEYSHAMCAFDIPEAQGQRFETEYGSFIMCETTAHVTPGMIAQEHADRSKWIVVD